MAKDENGYKENKSALENNLNQLLSQYNGPYFRGEEFSLVDTSVIPLIQRIKLTTKFHDELELADDGLAKLNKWIDNTLNMEEVKNSVPETFETDFFNYLKAKESFIAR